jgi:predicted DNA-binding transcriptional regulator AlpA
MAQHTFTLLVEGADLLAQEHVDALFDAGCDDALFGQRGSVYYADFDREATTFGQAIVSAIRDIQRAVPDARVMRIEPDEFVSLSAIAKRTGRSRESIRLLAEGLRGPGGFPTPERWVDARTTVWHWTEVAEWFENRLGERVAHGDETHAVAALNGVLEARRHVDGSPESVREAVTEFAHETLLRDALTT